MRFLANTCHYNVCVCVRACVRVLEARASLLLLGSNWLLRGRAR